MFMCISENSELRGVFYNNYEFWFGTSKISLSSGLETDWYAYEANDLCLIPTTKSSYL